MHRLNSANRQFAPLRPFVRWTALAQAAKQRSKPCCARRSGPGFALFLGPRRRRDLLSHADDHEGTRRDFLYYATAGPGRRHRRRRLAAGQPDEPLRRRAGARSIRVDVAEVEPGTQLTVKWLGKPVFIRRRTQEEIEAANQVDGRMHRRSHATTTCLTVPAPDANRTLAKTTGRRMAGDDGRLHPPWLCAAGRRRGDFGGWFCPCHGSHYDTQVVSARVPPLKTFPCRPPFSTTHDQAGLRRAKWLVFLTTITSQKLAREMACTAAAHCWPAL